MNKITGEMIAVYSELMRWLWFTAVLMCPGLYALSVTRVKTLSNQISQNLKTFDQGQAHCLIVTDKQ